MRRLSKISRIYEDLLKIALSEFTDIVESGIIMRTSSGEAWKLRIFFYDETFLDVYLSRSGKYSYHWDLRTKENKIYRHDNAPHKQWKHISTFPKHFHRGKDQTVSESFVPDSPPDGLRYFLKYIIEQRKD